MSLTGAFGGRSFSTTVANKSPLKVRKPASQGSADVSATSDSLFGGFGKVWLVASLGLFALTLWTFFPAIDNGFVGYDDPELVTENSHVQAGVTWENVKWAFYAHTAANWHPLTLLSHMLDCQWFGLAPWGHHLVSILGHALSATLLFLALQRMTGAMGRSLAVALLFALHPLRVESVVWVAERKDILSTLFGMLALWAYAVYTAQASRRDPRAKWSYGLTLLAFGAALLSKPMLVTLPFLLLLLDYWPLQRFAAATWACCPTGSKVGRGVPTAPQTTSPGAVKTPRPTSTLAENLGNTPTYRRLLIEKVPFLLVTLTVSALTYTAHSHAGDIVTNLSLSSRVQNAVVSYSRYVGKLLLPQGLSPFYPLVQPLPGAAVLGAGLLLVVGTVVAVGLWRRRPYGFVGWFWYLGMLVPVIGLVQQGDESMADRYTYMPCIGLLVAGIWGLHDALRPLRRRWQLELGLVAAASVACVVVTRQQVARWHDTETLFRHALAVTQANYIAHNNLGTALDKQGRVAEAIAEFRHAIEVKPGYARSYNNLGVALSEQGHWDEAKQQYLKAIDLNPDYANAYNNLGLAFAQQGQLDEARQSLARAIALESDYADAHYNLAQVLARAGRLEEAIAEYRATLKLQPASAEVHNNLGVALDRQGRTQEAINAYREAIRLAPDYARAYFNLGVILGKDGRLDDAIAAFQQAIKLKPDYAAAQSNLAQLVEAKRKGIP
jgi:protein O-mannosyl-transferase